MPDCAICNKPLEGGYLTVGDKKIHEACFTCANCATPLAGVPFMSSGVQHMSGFLCKPCYVDANCVKCGFCDEPITSGSLINAGGKKYHADCYDKMMKSGKKANAGQKAKPEMTCKGCGKEILAGAVRIGGDTFHPQCFTCANCESPLNGKKFFDVEGQYMCQPCAESETFDTCFVCGEIIRGSSFMLDDDDNKYHNKCYSKSRKESAEKCKWCSELILKGSLVRDRDLEGNLTGDAYHKACYDLKVKADEKAHADKIRAGAKEAKMAGSDAVKTKTLKEMEDSLEDPNHGIVAHGGQAFVIKRAAPTSGDTTTHTGGAGFNSRDLPPEMERDLAKVGAEKAAERISTAAATDLAGSEVNGIRFTKNGFCNTDIVREVKKKQLVVGKKTGTYKIKNGEVDCSFKEQKWTHRDFTGGKASKEERIRPIEHVKFPLP